MFRNCFATLPIAKIEHDDELKAYMHRLCAELRKTPVSKEELFKILVDVEDNYNFKSTIEELNKKQKKILLEEMEEVILKALRTSS